MKYIINISIGVQGEGPDPLDLPSCKSATGRYPQLQWHKKTEENGGNKDNK